jgi:hypothetical protein
MKSLRIYSTFVSGLLVSAMAIGIAASTQPASAQQILADKANIPFAFQVGSRTLPAGTYVIEATGDHLLSLRDPSQKVGDFVIVHDTYTTKTSPLTAIVFDRRGDKYFLRRISIAYRQDGLECTKSREEKQLELASSSSPQDTVTLALNAAPQR